MGFGRISVGAAMVIALGGGLGAYYVTAGAPPPPSTSIPAYGSVGASGTLAVRAGGTISGTFTNTRFTTSVAFGAGDTTCTNCDFAGGIATTYPGHGKVTLSYCTNLDGWYFEDQNGVGGQTNVFLDHCLLEAYTYQAIRPKGLGMITVTDTWIRSYGQPAAGAHTEAMQLLYGASGNWTRVAFSQEPVTNNTVTAVINSADNGAGDIYTDCVFGAYYPATGQWFRGGGYYMVYPGQGAFIRPTIYSPSGSAATSWYNGVLPGTLQNPTYLQG